MAAGGSVALPPHLATDFQYKRLPAKCPYFHSAPSFLTAMMKMMNSAADALAVSTPK